MAKSRFYQCRKTNLFIVKFKHEKAFRFGIQILKTRFHQVFYEKTGNNFLNNEQKIIYTEKRVKIFLNSAEQKIILCRMLEIVYAENSAKFLFNSEQFYLMQKKKKKL